MYGSKQSGENGCLNILKKKKCLNRTPGCSNEIRIS